jgi:hypothetical protein
MHNRGVIDHQPILGILSIEDAAHQLNVIFDVPNDIKGVQAYGTRDSWETGSYNQDRDNVLGLLQAAQDKSRKILSLLSELDKIGVDLNKYYMNPRILEPVLGVNFGSPQTMSYPDEIAAIPVLTGDRGPTDAVKRWLEPFSKLKLGRPPARSPNLPLRDALSLIARYWKDIGRKPQKEDLNEQEVRESNDPTQLSGEYERFAHDLLHATGWSFTLTELSAAIKPRRSKR